VFNVDKGYPNPFNNNIKIPFAIGKQSEVTAEVFNINGQSIIQLFNGQANTGNNILYWDGINQHGKEVPSGTYFLVIKNDNITRKQKILLLK
jgi:flagellar hook assembly protein FlgD